MSIDLSLGMLTKQLLDILFLCLRAELNEIPAKHLNSRYEVSLIAHDSFSPTQLSHHRPCADTGFYQPAAVLVEMAR